MFRIHKRRSVVILMSIAYRRFITLAGYTRLDKYLPKAPSFKVKNIARNYQFMTYHPNRGAPRKLDGSKY